ncbi:MAG: hypothetical protein KGZ57_10265 [Dethiobacter sp.]|jgi:hypothetical protein|nr:hypothetical protein [Dethiobacter sp.]
MPEKHSNPTVTDDLIREALRREIDSIEAPSTEAAWQRLQLHRGAFTSAPDEPVRRIRPWARFSALAAALLLFFFGGWGVYRTLYPGDFHGADGRTPESDYAEIMTAEESDERIAESYTAQTVSGYLAGWAPAEDIKEGDNWPPAALGGYTREEIFTREADSGAIYLAALYTRDSELLLWIQSDAASREQFAADLEQMLGVLPPLPPPGEDQLHFSINNQSALIRETEGRHYLLMDLSTGETGADLRRLLPEE